MRVIKDGRCTTCGQLHVNCMCEGLEGMGKPAGFLPTDSKERLEYPIFKGLLDYFPHACAAVAHHSHVNNEQHNPGEPMHWAKEKSVGTGDQIVRHLMEGDLAGCAWRALELLERKLTGLPPFDKGKKKNG